MHPFLLLCCAGEELPLGVSEASKAGELKQALKEWGLPVSGTKADLWGRLLDQVGLNQGGVMVGRFIGGGRPVGAARVGHQGKPVVPAARPGGFESRGSDGGAVHRGWQACGCCPCLASRPVRGSACWARWVLPHTNCLWQARATRRTHATCLKHVHTSKPCIAA